MPIRESQFLALLAIGFLLGEIQGKVCYQAFFLPIYDAFRAKVFRLQSKGRAWLARQESLQPRDRIFVR
jgi:hypothetical protein